jgi:hypothetical protein
MTTSAAAAGMRGSDAGWSTGVQIDQLAAVQQPAVAELLDV